ncbi:TRI15 transcription factor [Fusarium pseudoanthophilum]|uniref:TRI15 transcription factor n=1 Tax=Fusarium pseudoanthophilum TaxID=48495 RepID=A0A8H5KNK6_9HYPO|nr:TRI15 transcription factor [Fusarium pseudoanthophilum]
MTSTKPSCSLCDISFDNSQEHRVHAKSEAHVQALRNRATASGLLEQLNEDSDRFSHTSNDQKDELSTSDDETGDETSNSAIPEFDPTKCIICTHSDESFDETLLHMETVHGLRIPFRDHLIVDLETVIWYLYFLVATYRECIYCGTRRRTVEGIQQHMRDKGHCRVELTDEMQEFYDLEGLKAHGRENAVSVDNESLRLSSGKILSHRDAPVTKPRRTSPQEDNEEKTAPLPSHAASDALTAKDKKDAALASQLARLSVKDQQSLIHLTSSEQRSFLLQRKKELDAVRRSERKMRLKTERLSNRTMMTHFKNDVPGRSNG